MLAGSQLSLLSVKPSSAMSQTQSNAMPLPMAEPCQSRRQEAFDGHSCHSKNPEIRCVEVPVPALLTVQDLKSENLNIASNWQKAQRLEAK